MKPELRDQARNKWPSILAMCGVPTTALRNRHGPCPICEGTDRFRFDNKDGSGSWICNQCGAGDGMDLLMAFARVGFADAASMVRANLGEAKTTAPPPKLNIARMKAHCADLWRSSVPIAGTPAEAYLKARKLPVSAALRFHPATPITDHEKQALPAMLARVTDSDGNGVAIHRTYLENGYRSHRKLLSAVEKLPPTAAIRLADPKDGALGFCEGIETALAASARFQVPCWSLINTAQMAKFVAPEGLREAYVFGDHDIKLGGHAAAFALAHRIAVRPGETFVHMPCFPPEAGTDWADVWEKGNG